MRQAGHAPAPQLVARRPTGRVWSPGRRALEAVQRGPSRAPATIWRRACSPAPELTLVGGSTILPGVSDSGGRANLGDKDLVESVLRDLAAAADKWEALVAQAETITYSVDLGDIRAVVNSDGRLLELAMRPDVTTGYAHGDLADRLNLAIAALREEAEADNRARYGGELH